MFQRMRSLSIVLLALCLFSDVQLSFGQEELSNQEEPRFSPEDMPKLPNRRRPERSEEERQEARAARRARLDAEINRMRESGDMPNVDLDRMASGMPDHDVGSEEFMERKRQEMMDRIASMGGSEEMEKRAQKRDEVTGKSTRMDHIKMKREEREREHKRHRDQYKEDLEDEEERRGSPLDRFGAGSMPQDRADFFDSLHEDHGHKDQRDIERAKFDRDSMRRDRRRHDPHERDIHGQKNEPHPNPQIQARMNEKREKRNVK